MIETTTAVPRVHEARPAMGSGAIHPRAPRTLADAGLSHDFMTQLLLKWMHFGSDYSGLDLARRVGLEYAVIAPVLDFLKQTHQCEIHGGSSIGGPSYRYRITDEGRRRALLFLEHNHYVGVAPVPLQQYRDYMQAFAGVVPRAANRERTRRAFQHLVLGQRVLDQLGPGIAAGHSMFVYGPPGNGKTVIAQAIRNLLDGEVAVPHALEVEGQVIKFFDPVNHEPLPLPDESALTVDRRPDNRWVRCRRPMVMVGGELTLQALDLSYSQAMGFYSAPIQSIANGGVLVIDDFGRQHCSPRDLLNRWIVPLESRTDYLTLQTGQKFDMPFMALVVFATNIKPSELVDEAFLRRIHYKVFAESPARADFERIFENYCHQHQLVYDPAHVEHLLTTYFHPRGIQMRGCHPRDLIEQALAHAAYTEQPRRLTPELLTSACEGYFVDDERGLASA